MWHHPREAAGQECEFLAHLSATTMRFCHLFPTVTLCTTWWTVWRSNGDKWTQPLGASPVLVMLHGQRGACFGHIGRWSIITIFLCKLCEVTVFNFLSCQISQRNGLISSFSHRRDQQRIKAACPRLSTGFQSFLPQTCSLWNLKTVPNEFSHSYPIPWM